MAPKPASTAGKAPASTASKAPAKTTSEGGSKAAKKTAKAASGGAGEGDKKKRRKGRKETYSSYIYKGESQVIIVLTSFDSVRGMSEAPELVGERALTMRVSTQYSSRYTLTPVSRTRRWPSSTRL